MRRKKNSCCDPSRSRAGNRCPASRDFHRTSQDGRHGPGSGGDGLACRPAAGRCRWFEPTAPTGYLAPAEVRPATRGCAPSLCLPCWAARNCGALTTGAPAVSKGQFSTDAALDVENTELSPGVRRHVDAGGQWVPLFRSRPRADEAVGRAGSDHQSGRTDHGKHRCGYRPKPCNGSCPSRLARPSRCCMCRWMVQACPW
jgi:hypothetical protein